MDKELQLHNEIVNNLDEGIVLVRYADGTIVYTNPPLDKMFGYGRNELLGQNITILNAPAEQDSENTASQILEVLNKTGKWMGEVCNIKKDGTILCCQNKISLFDHPEYGRVGVSIITEITELRKAEEKIKQRNEDLGLINSLNEALNNGNSLIEILQLLVRETKRIFSGFGATVYLLSEDRKYLVLQISILPPAITSQIESLIGMGMPKISIQLKPGSLFYKALQEDKPELINDPKVIQELMAECTENKLLKKNIPKIFTIMDFQSMINVPLFSNGEAIGMLDISRKEPFTELDVIRIKSISGQVTSIIQRKKTDEDLKKHRGQLEDMVKARTIELESKNTKLERFNQLFVGREFRIKELRDQVKELEEQIVKVKK
jgi:PAS domain S-box-containing protein